MDGSRIILTFYAGLAPFRVDAVGPSTCRAKPDAGWGYDSRAEGISGGSSAIIVRSQTLTETVLPRIRRAAMATTARTEAEVEKGWSWWTSQRESNRCSRCGGFMVKEQLVDFEAHRCVQCGEVVDPVILENRQRSTAIGLN